MHMKFSTYSYVSQLVEEFYLGWAIRLGRLALFLIPATPSSYVTRELREFFPGQIPGFEEYIYSSNSISFCYISRCRLHTMLHLNAYNARHIG